MNYAIIDLGSNTVRLSVYDYEPNPGGEFGRVFTTKEVVGLAQCLFCGIMTEEGVERICAIIEEFREIALKFVAPENFRVFSTAALRMAENQSAVVETVRRRTGVSIDVIGGEEEARLDYIAAMRFAPMDKGLLIDIGGASTEIVMIDGGEPAWLQCLPVGCLSLFAKYVGSILPNEEEYGKIKHAVKRRLDTIEWEQNKDYTIMVGIGGTVRASFKLARQLSFIEKDERTITAKEAFTVLKLLRSNAPGTLAAAYRAIPDRLPTIIPGLIILKEAVKKFGCERLTLSGGGVREGYFIDRVAGGRQ